MEIKNVCKLVSYFTEGSKPLCQRINLKYVESTDIDVEMNSLLVWQLVWQ